MIFLWDWIIHRHIVDTIEIKNINVFKKDIYWKKYHACVKSIKDENKDRFIPKIKNGSIKIGANFQVPLQKLQNKHVIYEYKKNRKIRGKYTNIIKLYQTID
jgi:hypothetical protein